MVSFGPSFSVEVVDPVSDYLAALKAVFDFPALKAFAARPGFGLRFDALHAVTGPYARRIFVVGARLRPPALRVSRLCPPALGRLCFGHWPDAQSLAPHRGPPAHSESPSSRTPRAPSDPPPA